MILSAYERADSPFVRIQYADAEGRKRYIKTRIRKTDRDKAHRIAQAINKVEGQLLNRGSRQDTGGGWQWVPGWLRMRYAGRPATLRTYQAQWKWLALFLREHELNTPGAVERSHCFDYAEWRQAPVKEKSGRSPSINTAIGELKLFGQLLEEAKARGLTIENVARKLGLQRVESEPKPAMTDDELGTIAAALATRPQWMQRSFFMALQTGLRFSETRLARSQVQLERAEIVIEKPKGGRRRAFAIKIYPEIAPMIRAFMHSSDRELWSLPPKELDFASLVWTRFFREIGLSHLCFHCTRVTFITRGAMAGVPESVMMKLVNHASAEVHRIYQRLAGDDALRFRAKIAIPFAADATAGSRSGKGDPR